MQDGQITYLSCLSVVWLWFGEGRLRIIRVDGLFHRLNMVYLVAITDGMAIIGLTCGAAL